MGSIRGCQSTKESVLSGLKLFRAVSWHDLESIWMSLPRPSSHLPKMTGVIEIITLSPCYLFSCPPHEKDSGGSLAEECLLHQAAVVSPEECSLPAQCGFSASLPARCFLNP